MYRSIFHWRPLLNGYNSFFPVGFPERMALAARLPGRAALAALRRETGLTNVVVRLGGLPAVTRARWERVARRGRDDLRLVLRDGNELLFAVLHRERVPPS
jgi:hypothetical protein